MTRRGHPIFEFLCDLLDPVDGATVVDLGCGRGPALDALLRRNGSSHLIGLDADEGSITAAKDLIPTARAEVVDLALGLPLDKDSVDGALSHNVLECLDDPVAVMNETARVLRPGGRAIWSHVDFDGIIIAGPDRDLTRAVLHRYADHPPPWTPKADGQMGRQLAGLIRANELQLVDLAVHLTTATALDGDALARVEEIASSVDTATPGLSQDDVDVWRQEIQRADREGRFVFVEPCFVASSRSVPRT